jgi:hypothetical protein
VDRPQVIDSKNVLAAIISLTSFQMSVDSQSFFDITDVFPVGGESGTQVRSRPYGASWKRQEGQRGSISELLVEANMRCSEAKIEAPRR